MTRLFSLAASVLAPPSRLGDGARLEAAQLRAFGLARALGHDPAPFFERLCAYARSLDAAPHRFALALHELLDRGVREGRAPFPPCASLAVVRHCPATLALYVQNAAELPPHIGR